MMSQSECSPQSSQMNPKCLFCLIAHKVDKSTQLLWEDDNFAIFNDIRPAAEHHYLVVTKEHIANAKQLNASNVQMIKQMKKIGMDLLQDKGGDLNDVRMGFHYPPFTSISHLHLHVMSPGSNLSFISRIIFKVGTYWFFEVDQFIESLSKQKE